jgi:hypothetical protein
MTTPVIDHTALTAPAPPERRAPLASEEPTFLARRRPRSLLGENALEESS